MRYEETFELRDNDRIMRELSSSETNEVTGGTGFALVHASAASGPFSSLDVDISAAVNTSNSTAAASITAGISAVGPFNSVTLASAAAVF